jgi:hypothetical protein
MVDVHRETETAPQRDDQVGQDIRGNLLDSPACSADKVNMFFDAGNVIGGGTMPEMSMRDEFESLEEIQRPVHRRNIDPTCSAADLAGDLLRGGVAESGDGFQDELALRSETVTTGSQLRLPATP